MTDESRKISASELFKEATGESLGYQANVAHNQANVTHDQTMVTHDQVDITHDQARKLLTHATKRINGLRHRLDEAEQRRDHWFRERERELDNVENLQKRMAALESAMWMAFTTPVSVKKGSAEEKELQKLYEHLGKAMNWKVEKDGPAV